MSVEDITIADNGSMTPTIEQRKLMALTIERVKDIAPDWDEMTTRELLHLTMAVSKVTLSLSGCRDVHSALQV